MANLNVEDFKEPNNSMYVARYVTFILTSFLQISWFWLCQFLSLSSTYTTHNFQAFMLYLSFLIFFDLEFFFKSKMSMSMSIKMPLPHFYNRKAYIQIWLHPSLQPSFSFCFAWMYNVTIRKKGSDATYLNATQAYISIVQCKCAKVMRTTYYIFMIHYVIFLCPCWSISLYKIILKIKT